jgi:hypothetical protein
MRNFGELDINRAQSTLDSVLAEQVGVMNSDYNELVSGTTGATSLDAWLGGELIMLNWRGIGHGLPLLIVHD